MNTPSKVPVKEQWGFAITYSCNTCLEGTSVTSSYLPNIIFRKGALRSGAPSISEACGQRRAQLSAAHYGRDNAVKRNGLHRR